MFRSDDPSIGTGKWYHRVVIINGILTLITLAINDIVTVCLLNSSAGTPPSNWYDYHQVVKLVCATPGVRRIHVQGVEGYRGNRWILYLKSTA